MPMERRCAMMATLGFSEVMSVMGIMAIIIFGVVIVIWLGYCISSVARAADALERIADALEKDNDEEKDEVAK